MSMLDTFIMRGEWIDNISTLLTIANNKSYNGSPITVWGSMIPFNLPLYSIKLWVPKSPWIILFVKVKFSKLFIHLKSVDFPASFLPYITFMFGLKEIVWLV